MINVCDRSIDPLLQAVFFKCDLFNPYFCKIFTHMG
jgi:hypothetical protein